MKRAGMWLAIVGLVGCAPAGDGGGDGQLSGGAEETTAAETTGTAPMTSSTAGEAESSGLDDGGPSTSDDGNDEGSTGSPVPPGDDHTHFDTACAQPGVVACQSWRTQAEIDADAHSNQNAIQPGAENYPTYDPEADGARIPIIDGMGLAQLRHDFERAAGSVWVQYEMRLDGIAFTEPFNGLGMKIWRAEDGTKAGCNDQRRITHNIGLGDEAIVYHRDGCGVGEVRNEDVDPADHQPGGDTQCLYNGERNHPDCFMWLPDAWIRFTYHFDFAGQVLHIWAFRPDDDAPYKIVEYPVEAWDETWGMDVAGPWTHSTSRGHGNWPSVPEFGLYGRNLIVSTEEIVR